MKFALAFSICSIVTGFCNNPATVSTDFNKWSECILAGGNIIQEFSVSMEEAVNRDKLYITYFCTEVKEKGEPT